MLIKEAMPFVDNTAALPQSADPHLEQQGISVTIHNLQQLHNHIIYMCEGFTMGHDASMNNLQMTYQHHDYSGTRHCIYVL